MARGCISQTPLCFCTAIVSVSIDSDISSRRETFYQEFLRRFQKCPFYRLTSGAPIRELVVAALDSEQSGWTPEDGDKDMIAKVRRRTSCILWVTVSWPQYISDLLMSRAAMLRDYFSIDITDDGMISGLPLVLENHTPDLVLLPMFLLRLGTEVDWDAEQPCLQGVARELAEFYSVVADPANSDTISDSTVTAAAGAAAEGGPSVDMAGEAADKRTLQWTVQHVLYPTIRVKLVPPRSLAGSGALVELVSLETLYKVFERC